MGETTTEPPVDCGLCPRLVEFRRHNQRTNPQWHNAPVQAFGAKDCTLLIVGLAPGLKGANRTGRPFTGDYAGDLLYPTLIKFGWAKGDYKQASNDGLKLQKCRITNAVRCVPPENKPLGAEQRSCRNFLIEEIAGLRALKTILALGHIAHISVIRALALQVSSYPFTHGAKQELPNGILLTDSYHCSRYNLNTGRLTTKMFEKVIRKI